MVTHEGFERLTILNANNSYYSLIDPYYEIIQDRNCLCELNNIQEYKLI